MKITDLLNEAPIDMTGDPNDPTVYGHEKANPMSLKGRIMQARAQLKELAQLAERDDLLAWEEICKKSKGGMFMGLEQNLEQIRHGIEQLAAKRKQGGVASRGIDKNIGEQGVAEGLSKRDQQDVAAIKAAIERLQAQLKQPNVDKSDIQAKIAHETKRLALYKQGVAEGIPFAGAKVGQKPADQVRGTDRAKKISKVLGAKEKKHPFDGKLVGGM